MVKVLFSLGDWSVCSNAAWDTRIFANHISCAYSDDKGYWSWVLVDDEPKCDVCSTPVPDEIQGIVHMLSW